jgi:hypothetical protein
MKGDVFSSLTALAARWAADFLFSYITRFIPHD